MTGLQVKEKLVNAGYKLSDVAQKMNISPQSLHKLLLSEDIKTGVLERIAKAVGKAITFFLDEGANNEDDLKLINEIVSRQRLVNFLYQKIVDISVLNADYLKIADSYDLNAAAEITNNFCFPPKAYEKHESGELEVKFIRWEEFDIDKKKLYNAELGEAVRILQDIFFDRFKLLYYKLRGFDEA